MGLITKKKNISYWFNYCKKHNLDRLYLVIKNASLDSLESYQQYRIKYHEEVGGYALEVFSEDRFVFAFYTSPWDDQEYMMAVISNDIEEKEKFIIKNGQWVDKNSQNPEPIDYNKESLKRDLVTRTDGGKIVYYDFTTNNKLQ